MLPVCNFAAVDSSQGDGKKKANKNADSKMHDIGKIKTFAA